MKLYSDSFNLVEILNIVKERGYHFSNDSNPEIIKILLEEAMSLPFEYADHINYPINKNKSYKVTQSHERYYRMVNDQSIPMANNISNLWKRDIGNITSPFPELSNWSPKEIGYQKYRNNTDHISPHRDRWSDKQLSITYTLFGEAIIKIYESLTDPIDYDFINQTDEFKTTQGTMMFLRAPGFGNGTQIIHEVMPPTICPRYILNLRTRDALLTPPDKYK